MALRELSHQSQVDARDPERGFLIEDRRQPGDSAVSSGGGKRDALRRRDAVQSSALRRGE